jgi:hypothetical protein
MMARYIIPILDSLLVENIGFMHTLHKVESRKQGYKNRRGGSKRKPTFFLSKFQLRLKSYYLLPCMLKVAHIPCMLKVIICFHGC